MATPDPFDGYALHEQPGHLLRRAQQVHMALYAEATNEWGLTSVQYSVLVTVIQHPGVDQSTVAAAIAMDASTSGSVIGRLAERGLLARAADVRDRRAKRLFPTPEGEALARAMKPAVDRVQAKLLESLGVAERDAFLAVLRKLAGPPTIIDSEEDEAA